eukprot:CAMPEP_0117007700 /NCGR_PEP_ID=MMETSP0472-20121206/7488_1 /TAXON_ID=693140 ORGANISM="Tiarina fusus, Strain LIS" /NCGR_SAMPLE_ID=MMETSP0472 /ASSEMBLY_ACC=CAM_ASM_000603 /LENGTH=151 /DNA_ID=CAMNT_0004709547 /DNA_START=122 /DNA_END=577 /DNA_ORIENTATION=+
MPHTFNSCNYLFLLSIPEEIRLHFGIDGSPSRISDASHLGIMERISGIAGSLECMRENWPTRFTEDRKTWLFRCILFIHQEAANLQEVNDISFMAPESWEVITIFLELLDEFVRFLILLVHRESPPGEAEGYFGEVIVLIRFLSALNKIDA